MVTKPRRGLPLRIGLVAATLAAGRLRPRCFRHRGDVDPAAQPGQPHRLQTLLDASRGWAQAPRRQSPPCRRSRPGPAAVEFYVRGLEHRRLPRYRHQRPQRRTRASGRQRCRARPTTLRSVDSSGVQWRAVSVHGPTRELTTRRDDLSDIQHTRPLAGLAADWASGWRCCW